MIPNRQETSCRPMQYNTLRFRQLLAVVLFGFVRLCITGLATPLGLRSVWRTPLEFFIAQNQHCRVRKLKFPRAPQRKIFKNAPQKLFFNLGSIRNPHGFFIFSWVYGRNLEWRSDIFSFFFGIWNPPTIFSFSDPRVL